MMTNRQDANNENLGVPDSWPMLEIMQGKTSFPRRPVNKNRFLIGAGNICDLQLGDAEIPLLHSILLFQNGSLTCESMVSEPKLMLNGKVIRQATLINGDTLQIGKYTFKVILPAKSECRKLTAAFDQQFEVANLTQQIGPHEIEDCSEDLWNLPANERQKEIENMSASDLVDLLESELEQIEEMESIREAGLDTMISEAMQLHERDSRLRIDLHQPGSLVQKADEKMHEELRSLIANISQLSLKYNHREHQIPLSIREDLIEAQEQLQLMIYMMDRQKRSA